MSLVEKVKEYKVIIGFVTTVVGATVGFLAYANEQLEQQQVIIEAKAALIHNDFYQESRIARKQDQITEHNRELDNLVHHIGDNEPSARELRDIEYLDREISRLRKEIEEIRVALDTQNE
jgi:enoyl-[acyl-carrier-protein] reductase (NADH)